MLHNRKAGGEFWMALKGYNLKNYHHPLYYRAHILQIGMRQMSLGV